MKSVNTIAELRAYLREVDAAGVGFVPTMGALHAGHRSLVERARKECQTVVVSVFVNPTQFNDKTDLRNYPRTPEEDLALLTEAGADIVFMPSVEEIYPEPDTRQFDFGEIDKSPVRHSTARKSILRREGFSADSSNKGDEQPTWNRRRDSGVPYNTRQRRIGSIITQHPAR